MSNPVLVSHARNGEDVVLLRAMGAVEDVTFALAAPEEGVRWADTLTSRGWHRVAGPDATGVVAVLDGAAPHVVWWALPDAAPLAEALAATDGRPWVLVVETGPGPGAADGLLAPLGYTRTLDDGVSRYFVHAAHPELSDALARPASSRDGFVPARTADAERRAEELLGEVLHWRRLAVTAWADAVSTSARGDESRTETLERELEAMRTTLSWRVTRPLRGARRLIGRRLP